MEMGLESEVRSDEPFLGPILVHDTSTDRAAVGLIGGGGATFVGPDAASPRHGRGLVPLIRELLRIADLRPGRLAAIGVGLGPGSFTGLRIGLTAAKTLAYAAGCPLYGLDSLEAIARGAPGGARSVVAVNDAQRGDLFAADFARDADDRPLRRVRPTRLERADVWAAALAPGALVLGPPLGRAEPSWPESVTRDHTRGYPDALVLLEMTRERMMSGHPDDPWFLEPAYVRRSAAEEKAAGVVG